MAFKTAFSAVFRAFTGILRRSGVHVGETASYPRVELHSWSEGEPLDKGGAVREISVVVESMSTNGIGEAVAMAEENADRLLSEDVRLNGFKVIGIVPVQTQELSEPLDSQNTLYRVMQTLSVWVERV